jgi:hypothetical protein
LKGSLLVADSARSHPDGTFSLLRGGIDRVQVPADQPLIHRGSVVARLAGTAAEAGKHRFTLKVEAESREVVAPDIVGAFEIPPGGGGAVAVLDFGFRLTAPGAYRLVLFAGDQQLDTWRVIVEVAPALMPSGGKK